MRSGVRTFKDRIFKAVVVFFSFAATVPLFLIFFYIAKNGISSINWEFLLNLPKPVAEPGGGVSNAIIGTFILIILSTVISVPVGVSVGIYLSEHRGMGFSYVVSLCTEVIQGIPSVVIGIIAYTWVVIPMGGFSAISGSIALAIIMLPVIVKSTEEALNLIPDSLKEASCALGVPFYKTILKIILPTGLSGILTGVFLGIARIAGETAPLLFTAFGSPFMNINIFKPVNSLPLTIFNYAKSPYPEWHSLAWGASFILIFIVLGLNLTARLVTWKWKVQF